MPMDISRQLVLQRQANQIGYNGGKINPVVSEHGRQIFAYYGTPRVDPDKLANHLRNTTQQAIDWSSSGGYCSYKVLGDSSRVINALPALPDDLQWWDSPAEKTEAIEAAVSRSAWSQASIDQWAASSQE